MVRSFEMVAIGRLCGVNRMAGRRPGEIGHKAASCAAPAATAFRTVGLDGRRYGRSFMGQHQQPPAKFQ